MPLGIARRVEPCLHERRRRGHGGRARYGRSYARLRRPGRSRVAARPRPERRAGLPATAVRATWPGRRVRRLHRHGRALCAPRPLGDPRWACLADRLLIRRPAARVGRCRWSRRRARRGRRRRRDDTDGARRSRVWRGLRTGRNRSGDGRPRRRGPPVGHDVVAGTPRDPRPRGHRLCGRVFSGRPPHGDGGHGWDGPCLARVRWRGGRPPRGPCRAGVRRGLLGGGRHAGDGRGGRHAPPVGRGHARGSAPTPASVPRQCRGIRRQWPRRGDGDG